MSVYEKPTGEALVQTEVNLYGSSRLGILGKETKAPEPVSIASGYGDAKLSTFTRGERTFELSNHLGNVLATITDQKVQQTSDNTTVSYYTATVTTANDYYPFGMMMPGRRGYMLDQASGGGWSNGSSIRQNWIVDDRSEDGKPAEYKASIEIEFVDGFESDAADEFVAYITEGGSGDGGNGTVDGKGLYRYGFNGQERSDEINDHSYTAEYWQYDSRIGRRFNVDPVVKEYESPYATYSGNPIWFVDPHGADTTMPTPDGGIIHLPSGVSGIQTFDPAGSYSLDGQKINPVGNSLKKFTYNGTDFSAQYYVNSKEFAYYLGTDGSKLGYGINTLSSNIEFTGQDRIAFAMLLATPKNTNPYVAAGGALVGTGAIMSSLYHWNNISNDFDLSPPYARPFSRPVDFPVPFVGHGNRLDNFNPHMVYEISFVPGPNDPKTPIIKYGIADMYKSGNDRPESQMAYFTAQFGASVSWRPVSYTTNRSLALATELAKVTAHVLQYKEMPRRQLRPSVSWPF